MEVCSAFQMFLVGGCCLSAKGGGESGKELGEAETYRERSERRSCPNFEKGSIAGKHHLKGNG